MSIFSDLKPRSNANRNGFDLSRRVVFSNKPGVIRPCLHIPTLPSSEYEIDMAQLMRTQPLQTAAFTGASINYDFIFVPYNHLYSSFNQFIAQRDCKELANQPDSDIIPYFPLADFLSVILPLAAMDYLLAGVSDEEWQSTKYNGALQDFYIEAMPRYLVLSNSNNSYSILLSAISMLDMLGYGNYLPVVKQFASCFMTVMDAKVQEQTWDAPPVGVDKRIWYIMTFLASEGVNDDELFTKIPQSLTQLVKSSLSLIFGLNWERYINMLGRDLSLWPALAYNKAFYEYYRNSYYDEIFQLRYITIVNDLSEVQDIDVIYDNVEYVRLFNLDDMPDFDNVLENTGDVTVRLLSIFSEKLHQYKRDMFTGVLPSTQFGNVSTMATDSIVSRLHRLFMEGASGVSYQVKVNSGSNNVIVNNSAVQDLNTIKIEPALAISVLEARKADAMQRFRERMLRAGNKTKDIFEAHGWDRPKSQSAFEPVFLGSYDGSLDINVVASTTESDTLELGQLGANGVCVVRGNKIRIKTSDFGEILCLQYIVKSSEYDSFGIDRTHALLEAFDFPYPELQNISLVPISQDVLNIVSPLLETNIPASSKILGYLPRSYEYKTAVDKVHGEFYGSNFLPYAQPSANEGDVVPLGVFSDWVTTRKDTFYQASDKLSFHYIQIDCMDNIFKLRCTADPATDPFLFNVNFDIKAVQPLPVIGLPM